MTVSKAKVGSVCMTAVINHDTPGVSKHEHCGKPGFIAFTTWASRWDVACRDCATEIISEMQSIVDDAKTTTPGDPRR